MLIGIDSSRAFLKDRTGIEEYSYQVIKNLADKLKEHEIILYIRKNQKVDFELPKNWKIKKINFYYLWTQVGLSLEMFFHPVDVLFIPAHTVPVIHPKNTIVTIHGLEYEFCPNAYSFWEKIYMRCSIRKSCQWGKKIIAVSENTKKDLINLYKIKEEKISVIYNGYANEFSVSGSEYKMPDIKYLLFIGRLEERKNVIGIIKTFEVLKEQYKIPHKLFLAGKPGFGYGKIKNEIAKVNCRKDIIELGFIDKNKKAELLKKSDVFLFPSFYEGFGLPILEAQSAGVPVVTSNVSSIPEVANGSAILVDPNNSEDIADAVYKLISDENIRQEIIKKGQENVQRFSWEKCAEEIAQILMK
ncbi:MAG TPA: glycosyltransferase family 1 protein [Candidatus Moranbacteria bacterium]|nr:glycosyltransferase family 1 protein [Candidatus Moranbacteria bacterium]HRZ33657.1 glycosyltransferase family 1 protein [Candidatus Moranbacteria bacterium]